MSRPSAFNSDASEPKKQLQLVVHAGPLAGKGFPITGDSLTFGRDPENDITLDDSQVSRFHARLIRQGDEVSVEDLGSTNGTMINGDRITGQKTLQPADIISIGSSVFGIKGFSAPNTLGVTQVSSEPVTFTPPRPAPKIPDPSPSSPGAAPQAAPRPGPAPVPMPKAQPQKGSSNLTFLAIGGGAALIVSLLLIILLFFYFSNQGPAPTTEIPTVIISAPLDNSQININQPLTVQATGSAATGVKRMELWVRGVKANEAVSPAADGQPTLTASFQWTPEAVGSYTLEVRAYTAQGLVSSPTGVTITAVDPDQVDGDDTPTPTLTPEPIETVPGNPQLTTLTDLNVRGGPGIEYDLLGLLPTGTDAEIIGRDATREWWQVRFDPASDGRGWVAANTEFSTAFNVENVPVAQPPPTPTGTPTATTEPATATATPTTPAAPTDTPTPTVDPGTETPTPTPTSQGPTVEFSISPTSIQGGDCVTINWEVTDVKEVYLDGNGVAGNGTLQDCPQQSKVYQLRVVKQDDTQQTEQIQVEVVNPISIKSSGVIVLDKDETLDIDDGDIPGDDFVWDVDDDDGDRRFQALDDVQIAPMRNIGSLSELSRSECVNANYGAYSYIDASNSAPDPNNTLIDGRSACFKTNKNRIGKLRFPNYSTDDLKIEWLTWQN